MIRMTRLQVKNYRGVKAIDADVSGNGVIARGRNGSGKSSAIGSISAALAANDIGPDAIRIGEDDGEILITLDVDGRGLHVRRKFGPNGSSLKVTNDEGDAKAKPTTVLGDLLGTAPLDVVAVVLEKDKKKRRERILGALAVKVPNVAFLRQWVPGLPDGHDISGHGLEVIDRLRAAAYERRTDANKKAKDDRAASLGLAAEASERRAKVLQGPTLPVDEAQAEETEARAKLEQLRARRDAAARAAEKMSGLRADGVELRARAMALRASAGTPPDDVVVEGQRAACEVLEIEISTLEETLRQKRDALGVARRVFERSLNEVAEIEANRRRAAELDERAASIESSLAEAIETVTESEIEEALQHHNEARAEHEAAIAEADAREHENFASASKRVADASQTEADRLDVIVKALSTDAPAALLAQADGAPAGLRIEGDEIWLDGVNLDKVNSAEQMKFAAGIARALNPKVGFMICDGLERLDEDQLNAFIAEATRDGRQLFGALVARGELSLVHIEEAAESAAAE